jgi:hypothetical protein
VNIYITSSFAIPNSSNSPTRYPIPGIAQYTAIAPSVQRNTSFRPHDRAVGSVFLPVVTVVLLSMNSGQYHQRPQLHGLPINFQYSNGSEPSEQSTSSHPMLSCDGLPRPQQQSSQHFMTTAPVSSSTLLGTNYDIVNSMPLSMSQGPLWTEQSQHPTSFEDSNTDDYYDYSPGLLGSGSDNSPIWLRDMEPGIPRFMPGNPSLYNSSPMESYNAPMYLMHGNKPDLQSIQNRSNISYPSLEEPRDHFARLSISHSPGVLPKTEDEGFGFSSPSYDKPPPFITSKASSEDGAGNSSREMTAMVDLEEHSAEEPYAKLIYRALMSRPNYTMVLQEIYQWFRDNTAKGSSDGKGWMNSIRHNLSMNAVCIPSLLALSSLPALSSSLCTYANLKSCSH